jgi:hypothetical protein
LISRKIKTETLIARFLRSEDAKPTMTEDVNEEMTQEVARPKNVQTAVDATITEKNVAIAIQESNLNLLRCTWAEYHEKSLRKILKSLSKNLERLETFQSKEFMLLLIISIISTLNLQLKTCTILYYEERK